MATERGWLKLLKALRKEPRALSPAELDELILLLGGTTRPKSRPEVKVFGMNRRQLNYGGIGSVVFSFMENAECLSQLEAEIQELNSPDFMEKYQAELPHRWSEVHTSKMTAKNRANAVRITKENVTDRLQYLESRIAALRQISAKDRTAAEHMAVNWFAMRDVVITRDQIKNELGSLREKAGLKRLGLAEWRALMEIEKAQAKKKIQQSLKTKKILKSAI